MLYVTDSFQAQPLVSSAPLAWRGVRVEQLRLEAGGLPAHHHTHHLLLLYQVAKALTVRLGAGVKEQVFRTGNLGLYPSGDHGPVAWDTACNNIYLMVDDQHLERVARQDLDLTHFALRERFGFDDPFLAQLGWQLLAAAGSHHALGLLYIESLTNALCHHLIEHHAIFERRPSKGHPLTGLVLARIDAYLEAHAETPVTLETLADLANMSVFHFARLFKQATGLPPYQYVLSWKMRRAQQLLRLDHAPVTDISDALGFASPASFSAAFKRVVGRSPQEFQRKMNS